MNGLQTWKLESAQRVRRIDASLSPGLQRRIELLDKEDRVLIELVQNESATHRRIGRVLGLGPGTVTRRLQRLAARLHDPLVVRLLENPCSLGPEYRQIGVEHFLIGRTIAKIAAARGMTRSAVREALMHVRLWHRVTRDLARG